MVRNMVTAKEAFLACHLDPVLMPFGRTDPLTYGKAMKYVRGWDEIGKVRRHGTGQQVWFTRNGQDNARWVPVEQGPEDEDDGLLS